MSKEGRSWFWCILFTGLVIVMSGVTATLQEKAKKTNHEDGYRLGYQDGFVKGDHNGRRECCVAVCAADNSIGIFDEGGCFCITKKESEQFMESQGLPLNQEPR